MMMMAFDHHPHRKFLISETDHKNPKSSKKFATETDCYLCYVCPENCYVSSPPPPPQLSPPPPPPPLFSSKYHIPTVLILMLCVLGVAFLVLSYLTLARYRCRNSRTRNPEPLETSRSNFLDGPVMDHPIWYIRTVGLPQSVIDSIESFAYKKGGDGLVDGNDCSVCLSGFEDNETLRLLPKCRHAFHLECIDMWLGSHKSCPVCRAPVVVVVESSLSSSGSRSNEVEGDDDLSTQTVAVEVSDDRVGLGLDRDLQGVRRSVSMDFSMIKNSRSSLQIKRSFSFSYKFC